MADFLFVICVPGNTDIDDGSSVFMEEVHCSEQLSLEQMLMHSYEELSQTSKAENFLITEYRDFEYNISVHTINDRKAPSTGASSVDSGSQSTLETPAPTPNEGYVLNSKGLLSNTHPGASKDKKSVLSIDEFFDQLPNRYVRFQDYSTPLIEKVKAALQKENIFGAVWTETNDQIHVGVFVTDKKKMNALLISLSRLRIGFYGGSSVSVFTATKSISWTSCQNDGPEESTEKNRNRRNSENILKSLIKSRLVVAMVADALRRNAILTINIRFLMLFSSLLAIMGLAESNVWILLFSTLFQCLMGPILASIFGNVVQNLQLAKSGLKSIMKSLTTFLFYGFFFGLIPAFLEAYGLKWRSADSWPTSEMSYRSSERFCIIGLMIALPVGACVGMSIICKSLSSLVCFAVAGVCIPAIVNAGLLFATAAVTVVQSPPVTHAEEQNSTQHNCSILINNKHNLYYSCVFYQEILLLGLFSLLQGISYLLVIIVVANFLIKMKEKNAAFSGTAAEIEFFLIDMKVARHAYIENSRIDNIATQEELLKLYQKIIHTSDNEYHDDIDLQIVMEIVEEIESSDSFVAITKLLPFTTQKWAPPPLPYETSFFFSSLE